MRIGFVTPHAHMGVTSESMSRFVRAVDASGFHSLWVSDHIAAVPEVADEFGPSFLESTTTLAYVAAETSSVSVGFSALVVALRNPTVLARTIASLDFLSDGRLLLGVVPGWSPQEFDEVGVPFGNRGLRTDQTLQRIIDAWARDEISPAPIQDPHPPIWIGGNSRRSLERAVRFGEAWHLAMVPDEKIRWASEMLRSRDTAGAQLKLTVRLPLRVTSAAPTRSDGLVGTSQEIALRCSEIESLGVEHLLLDPFTPSTSWPDPPSIDEALGWVDVLAPTILRPT